MNLQGSENRGYNLPVLPSNCESYLEYAKQVNDVFVLWCWERRLLRAPWTARRSNQSILKETSPGCSLEGLMLKLKLRWEELIPWKRPWCWERLKAGGEGGDRGGDGWMASPTWWTWAWVNSGSRWWTGRSTCCSPWGLQRVGHNLSNKQQ